MNLKDIQKPIAHLLEETNTILLKEIENYQGSIRLIHEVSNRTPISQGKKIRSTLLFMLAGLNDSLTPDLPSIAASIEMLHLSSLIHDDVVDNSELRRGKKTLNSHFGNTISVLWGDFLFIHSLHNFNKHHKRFTDIVLDSACTMVEGQLLEVQNTHNYDIALDTYFDIIAKKTSSLFAGVAQIASSSNGSSSAEKVEEFSRFGLNFGSMFQISDDILDIFSEDSGKDRFRDLKEGKITLPIILLIKENQVQAVKNFSEENQEDLLTLSRQYRIKELSLEQIIAYYDRCQSFLVHFPPSIYRESLADLLHFIKSRNY